MAYIFDLVDTWASGGGPYTSIKMNATDNDSGSASLLMDLQVGGASKFKVAKSGDVTLGSSSILMDAVGGSITAGGTYSSNAAIGFRFLADLFLRRRGAANLALGAADAAAPVAQTLSVQSVVAGTSNTAGTNLTITGSQGTGNAAGGSIIFQVAPAGSSGSAQNALATALTIGSDKSTRLEGALDFSGTGTVNIQANVNFLFIRSGTYRWGIGQDFIATSSTAFVGFSSVGTDIGGTTATNVDTRLYRDAANTLALRNGTAAQLFNIYRTYTDASNYERLSVGISGSNFDISVENAGTGVARPLRVFTTTSSALQLGTVNVLRWNIDTSGHFVANADNTYDIGASGANRPRDIYIGGTYRGGNFRSAGYFEVGAAQPLLWASRSYVYSPADGNILIQNNANTDFGRLQFGGTTSSFPALKRSTTALEVRLADDSAYATFSCLSFNAYGGITFRGSTESARRLAWNGVGQIRVQSDGVFTIMNDAATDFNRLQFGGTDANFPALKRSTTSLQARLADDSAFASVQGKLTTETAYTAGAPTATGYLVVYDSTGTAYRIPAVLN